MVTKFRKCDLPFSKLDSEIVVMDLASDEYIGLNETASWIWCNLDIAKSGDEIAIALAENCCVPVESIAEDVDEFLAELVNKGLIQEIL